ncbi:hypothetical protein OROMI_003844 [Orobanche minor]
MVIFMLRFSYIRIYVARSILLRDTNRINFRFTVSAAGLRFRHRIPAIQAVQAGNILTHHHRLALVAPITADEIYKSLKSIGDARAAGADGFTAKFYKCSWHIIGSDIVDAIQDFFLNGRLLKSLNASLITLIPKSQTANSIRDYRPIACCNVLYKIISKVITNRLGKVMQYLTGDEQAAFVPG